jgi:protocatechuate 3,4-dioxygenase beta subunit
MQGAKPGGSSVKRVFFLCVVLVVLAAGSVVAQCKPTPGSPLDPEYSPSAPKRANVGSGFVLTGTVRGADDCSPLAGATIEFWLSGPNGYTDKLRGTVVADKSGRYRFQCPFPVSSGGPAPHIHIAFSADGFMPILTEIFPNKGSPSDVLDVVLELGD